MASFFINLIVILFFISLAIKLVKYISPLIIFGALCLLIYLYFKYFMYLFAISCVLLIIGIYLKQQDIKKVTKYFEKIGMVDEKQLLTEVELDEKSLKSAIDDLINDGKIKEIKCKDITLYQYYKYKDLIKTRCINLD